MRVQAGWIVLGAALAAVAATAPAGAQPAPPGTHVSSFRAPSAVTPGERAGISGRIAPGAAATVAIERLQDGAWTVIATTTSRPGGAFGARLPLRRPSSLRASVQAADGAVAVSRRRFVAVRRRVSVRVTAAPLENIAGRPFEVTGAVVPAGPRERVALEGSVDGGRYRTIARLVVRSGRVKARFTPPSGGTWRFRLAAAARPGLDSGGTATTAPMHVFGANPHGAPAGAEHHLVQRISEFRLYYYQRGALRRVFPVVFGAPSTPTPVGTYRVYSKTNGPSAAFGPRVLWYHRGYGIHGTNQEHLLSHTTRYYSHGCTRNYNANILWLWDRVPVGTTVVNMA